MKKLLIILLLAVSTAVLASPGAGGVPDVSLLFSQVEQRTITIAWTQEIIPDFLGWKLYGAEVQGGPYDKITDILFGGDQQEYESSQIINLSSQGGTIYIVMTSFNSVGESGFSNEASKCFQIPNPPYILRIVVVMGE